MAFLDWSGPPSESAEICHSQHLIKKVLVPLREQGQKVHFLRYHLVCRMNRPLCPVPTHRLPVNAGNASEDTGGESPFLTALCGPFAAPLFAPLSAPGTLCGCAIQLYSRIDGFNIGYDFYTPNVCVCQELFYAVGGQISIPGPLL